jgi:hypothetical protein
VKADWKCGMKKITNILLKVVWNVGSFYKGEHKCCSC